MLTIIHNVITPIIGYATMAGGIILAAQPMVEEQNTDGWIISMADSILEEQNKRKLREEKEWKEAAAVFAATVDRMDEECRKNLIFISHRKMVERIIRNYRTPLNPKP